MSNGQGCTCSAWSENECCCEHVDWRSEREVELEIENAAMKAELASLTNGVKIQIPSNTLEQEYSSWHRRGYNKAKDEMHQEVERLKAEITRLKSELQDLHKRNYITHSLFETGDTGCPEQAKDRNGEVVLGVCRNCGRIEAELAEPCDRRKEIARLREALAKCRDGIEGSLSDCLPYINKCKEALAAIKEERL